MKSFRKKDWAHLLADALGNAAFGSGTRLRRDGFSLLEIFLVMAILATISIIGLPMLHRPLNQSVVQDAAQILRRDLAVARLQAMERGRPVFFQYQPETSEYWIGTSPLPIQTSKSTDSGSMSPGEFENPDQVQKSPPVVLDGQNGSTRSDSRQHQLPGKVIFSSRHVELLPDRPENSRKSGLQLESTSKPGLDNDSHSWSSPIRFYPSGRIVPTRISMQSAEGYFVEVEIQGLAGRVKVLPIHR